ncbi:MAG TPA: hypothetical protein V6C97_17965 [Oculatellaceae cyanobacterium]
MHWTWQKQNSSTGFAKALVASFALANSLSLSLSLSICALAQSANDSAGKPSRLLTGGAKDKEEVNSSVRLMLPSPQAPKPVPQARPLNASAQSTVLNGGAKSTTLNGGADTKLVHGTTGTFPLGKGPPQSSGASAAPVVQITPPKHDVVTPVSMGNPVRLTAPPTPPPKWNYTMTPKNGVMTWAPGYTVGTIKEKPSSGVRLQLSQPSVNATLSKKMGFEAVAQPIPTVEVNAALKSKNANAAMLGGDAKKLPSAPPAMALQATPQLLTEVHSKSVAINWSDWYRRICRCVYDQWLLDEATPGRALVRVTVWPGREIEARVLNFTPVEEVRDAKRETVFRETALRAINSLEKTSVLDYPIQSSRQKIVFDLDMARSVSGPSGCQVAALHDIEGKRVTTYAVEPSKFLSQTKATSRPSTSASPALLKDKHLANRESSKEAAKDASEEHVHRPPRDQSKYASEYAEAAAEAAKHPPPIPAVRTLIRLYDQTTDFAKSVAKGWPFNQTSSTNSSQAPTQSK